jgi:Spy/CpxP family protein refolding chaperone
MQPVIAVFCLWGFPKRALIAALSLLAAYSVAPAMAGNPKPAAGGQMICSGPSGCRPVRHIEPSIEVGQVEVCGNSKRPE